jgi:hypothetical protein
LELRPLEKAILNWIKINHDDPSLGSQIDNLTLVEREYTKVGFYLDFSLGQGLPSLDLGRWTRRVIYGPSNLSPWIDHHGGSHIFYEKG